MLVIRREQMQVFDEYASKGFEDRLVRHLAERFPDVCREREEASVRETIRNGIERSKGYGITTEFDVARYIELMYLFSEDFDTNPETSWASPVLEDTDLGGHAKMDRLREEAAQRKDSLEP